MYYNKVEICGVNTADLKTLSDEEKKNLCEMMIDKLNKNNTEKTGLATAKIMQDAGQVVIVYADRETLKAKDSGMYSLMLSVGACIENMILAYTDMGLGTIWIGNTNLVSNEIKEILNVPYETVSCVGVGYQDQFPKARPRKDISDVLLR